MKNITDLPNLAYAEHPITNETMLIYKGKRGLFPVPLCWDRATAAELNELAGVETWQANILRNGALYGWDK